MAEKTQSSIEINASAAQVLAVIADLAAYPQWSEGIAAVDVLSVDAAGRPATAHFRIDSAMIKDSYELAYTWSDDGVSWHMVRAESLLKALDGRYLVVPADGGSGTTVTYTLEVDLRIPMIGMMKRKAERVIIDTALKGLKERVESGATGPARG